MASAWDNADDAEINSCLLAFQSPVHENKRVVDCLMPTADVKKCPFMRSAELERNRKRKTFDKGYAEFVGRYSADERLHSKFALPLDFSTFNTAEFWNLDEGPCHRVAA